MNNLQTFCYQSKEVRTIMKDGEPWWVLEAVCDALQIQNATDVAKRLDEDEVTRFNLGGLSRETNIVSESGLYKVIIRSDKPESKEFRRWVTHEVLPTIRKQGYYSLTNITNTAIAEIVVETVKQLLPTIIQAMKESIKETIPQQLQAGTQENPDGYYTETVYIRKKIGTEPLQIYKDLKLKDLGIGKGVIYRYINKYF